MFSITSSIRNKYYTIDLVYITCKRYILKLSRYQKEGLVNLVYFNALRWFLFSFIYSLLIDKRSRLIIKLCGLL